MVRFLNQSDAAAAPHGLMDGVVPRSPHGDLERGKPGRAAERKLPMRHSRFIWIMVAACIAILLLASRRFRGSLDGMGGDDDLDGSCAEKLSKLGITAQGDRLKVA